jgi:hypothetical protein
VAVWWGFVMLIHLARLMRDLGVTHGTGETQPSLLSILVLPGLALIVLLLVNFVRLNRVSHWFCIAHLSFWTLSFTCRLAILLWRALSAEKSRPSTRGVVVVILFSLFIVSLNVASVWYLSRREFREACKLYLKEKLWTR